MKTERSVAVVVVPSVSHGCVCATQNMTTPKFEESLCNSFQIYRTQQFILAGQTNGSQLEVKWRAVCEEYNLVLIRGHCRRRRANKSRFLPSPITMAIKIKTLDGKQWRSENEEPVGARAHTQDFVLTRHMKNWIYSI